MAAAMRRRLRGSPLATLAADVRCLARRDGLRSALATVGRGIAGSVSTPDEMHVLLKPLDEIAPVSLPSRLRLVDADPAGLAALAALNRGRCDTRADRRFAANLARGWQGFVASEDGAPVGWYWWLDDRGEPHPHLPRLGIDLPPGDVYGFDFFLAEDHRGEGRAVEFLHAVETRLRDRGYERLWGYVAGANTPARWLYSMRGYATVRTVHLRPGSMRQSLAGSDAPGSAP